MSKPQKHTSSPLFSRLCLTPGLNMTFIEMDCMKNVMTFLSEKPQAKSALHCIIMLNLVINNTNTQTHNHNGVHSLHMEKMSQ